MDIVQLIPLFVVLSLVGIVILAPFLSILNLVIVARWISRSVYPFWTVWLGVPAVITVLNYAALWSGAVSAFDIFGSTFSLADGWIFGFSLHIFVSTNGLVLVPAKNFHKGLTAWQKMLLAPNVVVWLISIPNLIIWMIVKTILGIEEPQAMAVWYANSMAVLFFIVLLCWLIPLSAVVYLFRPLRSFNRSS